ncbi:MAG: CCA tRNA nucleotidyltransferase [Aquificae bacterium]|nr:CCA tRNA nucleotidyltransferase [Aquificota bacterium]
MERKRWSEAGEFLKLLADLLPQGSYLVGGTVRDLLLGREPADFDAVVPAGAEAVARRLAQKLGGSYFGFKKEHLPVRGEVHTAVVPFKGRSFRVDLSEYRSLEEDLGERDFTVNAMALSPKEALSESPEPVDPFGGLADLGRRLLRPVRYENLLKDPLRMLRAYRLARELDFKVEPALREFVRKNARLLASAAPERTLAELLKPFKGPSPSRFLEDLLDGGLAAVLLSPLSPEEVQKGLSLLRKVEGRKPTFGSLKGGRTFLGEFDEELVPKLAALFAFADRKKVEDLLGRYPFGRELKDCVLKTLGGLAELEEKSPETAAEKAAFLKRFEGCLFPILELALAMGLKGEAESLASFYRERYRRFKKPLLDGREVMRLLGIKPSPLVGRLLEELTRAQLEGRVSSTEEARDLIFKLFERWRKRSE